MELTQQQKLEILCAYLPYGVEVEVDIYDRKKQRGILFGVNQFHVELSNIRKTITEEFELNLIEPILRHPDDMTNAELSVLSGCNSASIGFAILRGDISPTITESQQLLRYLHSIHIDTFGAIDAGFAIRKNINEKGNENHGHRRNLRRAERFSKANLPKQQG